MGADDIRDMEDSQVAYKKGSRNMEKMNNSIMAETDMEELWELNGRVKALIGVAKKHTIVSTEEIFAILGYEEYGQEEVKGEE